ncbi:MAG: Repeat-Containing Protein [Bacteroidetes bacterium]|jgi:DNA-binding CsgD family transcriptional regulator|nr:Repeat-Containing Protein [Bacteroidota bacterium]
MRITPFLLLLIVLAQHTSGQNLSGKNELLDTVKLDMAHKKALDLVSGKPKEALELCRQNLTLARKLNNTSQIIKSLYGVAWCFQSMGQHDSVSYYIFKGLNLSEDINNKALIAEGQKRVGNLYLGTHDYYKGLEWHGLALAYYQNQKDTLNEAIVNVNRAACYSFLKKYQIALEILNRSEQIIEPRFNDQEKRKASLLSNLYINKAYIYSKTGDTILAIANLEKSYQMAKSHDQYYMLQQTCNNLGAIYYLNENYPMSKKYLLEAVELSPKVNNLTLNAEIYRTLAYVYEQEKSYKPAFEFLVRNHEISDSMSFETQIMNANRLDSKYKAEKNELEMVIKDSRIRLRNNLIVIIILSSVLVLSVLYIILLRTKKFLSKEIKVKNEIIKQKDEVEKELELKNAELINAENMLKAKKHEIDIANALLEKRSYDITMASAFLADKNHELEGITEALGKSREELDTVKEVLSSEIEAKEKILSEKEKTDFILSEKISELKTIEVLLEERNLKLQDIGAQLSEQHSELERTNELLEEKNKEIETVSILLEEKTIESIQKERSLDKKNEELIAYAVLLAQKNEIIQNSIDRINHLNAEIPSKISTNLKGIVSDLKYNNNETTWREFEQRFMKQHSDFYEKLARNFPDLTPNEIRMCALLKLNMSTKEIASITIQTIRAVEVARHRIRKKMNLPKESNLVNYLKLNT